MIVDGNALIHRSFHALPPTMATKNGEITNAVYGFTSFLLRALKEFSPEYVAVTFDLKGPTFRHEKYDAYKATRIKAPDELYAQMPRVKEVVRSLNIPIYELKGYEADDLIGTIARSTDGSIKKIIVTGDMDTLQLVNEHTQVYTMSRGLTESVTYDEDAVRNRFGLEPSQLIDYKALRGDPSDNIPGVRGIGEKTAVDLLKEFGSLKALYEYVRNTDAHSNRIKPRILEMLKVSEKGAKLSQDLAKIRCDAPMAFKLEDSKREGFNLDAAADLFSELEFKSLLPRLKDIHAVRREGQDDSAAKKNKFKRNREMFKYRLINDAKSFSIFEKKLNSYIRSAREPMVAFDTETTSFDPLDCELLGISLSWYEGEAYFIMVPPDERMKNKNSEQGGLFGSTLSALPKTLARIRNFLEDERIHKVAHNAKFDIRVLKSYGINVRPVSFDTMIASYLLNPGSRQHNLDAVTFSEVGFDKISKDDLLGKGRERIPFASVPLENLSLYSCEDADFTRRLYEILFARLQREELWELFSKVEMPLVPVLAAMEDRGVRINVRLLKSLEQKLSSSIRAIEKKIWKEAGTVFNVNSTKQLREVLYDRLGIATDGVARIRSGLSTKASELEKLNGHHPIIAHIQEYRELSKLQSTYLVALPKLVNKHTGRLHTSFNQTITSTGRLSSADPNLQNIPVRTDLGNEVRKAFVSEPGYSLVSLDYSQIELRLAAHLSGDQKMISAFKKGLDIHTSTAAEIYGIALEDVTKEMRREAKAINFGILYGQGPHGLSQTAGIPYAQAKEFIDGYFRTFSCIKGYIESSVASARTKGYVMTLFGRKRPIPEIDSSVVQVRKAAERMAVNTPIQGTAADMLKTAMIRIGKLLEGREGEARMILTVHDELVFEIKEGLEHELAKDLAKIMESVIKLDVPVLVDVFYGKSWGDMERLI